MISAPPVTYTVQAGDTMSAVAQTHHVPLNELEMWNPQVANPDLVYAGDHLNLGTAGHGNASPSNLHGVYGHPYTCGDGDGDGWDMPCSELHHDAAPAPATQAPVHHSHSVNPVNNPAPVQQQQAPSGGSTAIPSWAKCIVQRESGGNPRSVNSVPGWEGNGGGLFGDLKSTWNGYGGYAQPFQAPVSVQIQFNEQLHNQMGLSPWAADGCPGTR